MQQIRIIETNSTRQLEEEVNKFLDWLVIAPIGIGYRTAYREYEDGEKHQTHIAYIRYSPSHREYYISEIKRVRDLVASWPCNQKR